MLNCNHFSYTKTHLSGVLLGDWRRKCSQGLGLRPPPTFCFELFLYEMINLIEKYEPFTHSSYIGIYLVSIAFFSFYGYILHWQGRIPLFLKSNITSMEKRPPDKKHKKDLGKIILKSKCRQLSIANHRVHLNIAEVAPLLQTSKFQKLVSTW